MTPNQIIAATADASYCCDELPFSSSGRILLYNVREQPDGPIHGVCLVKGDWGIFVRNDEVYQLGNILLGEAKRARL